LERETYGSQYDNKLFNFCGIFSHTGIFRGRFLNILLISPEETAKLQWAVGDHNIF
jgi:hypothetical protein